MTNIAKIETKRRKVVVGENFGSSPEFVEMRKHFPKWLMIKSVRLVECRSHEATDGRLIVLKNKYSPSADAIVNLKLPCPMAPSWGIEYFKTAYPQFAHINVMDNVNLMCQ